MANIKNSKKLGFSLIELSIVLIIIGLLVAGITGGASLIKSAKTRKLVNEFRGHQVAIMAFYSANGRYPGDLENSGSFGDGAYTGTKTISGFTDFDPTAEEAPFVELYIDRIGDFTPTTAKKFPSSSSVAGEYKFSGNSLVLTADMEKKVVEQIDKILDDGIISSGKLTASCGGEGHWEGKNATAVLCVPKAEGEWCNGDSNVSGCLCPTNSKTGSAGCIALGYGIPSKDGKESSDSNAYCKTDSSSASTDENTCSAVIFQLGL